MATLEELSTALVNADAAGDVEAARALAGEIQKIKTPQRGVVDKLLGTSGPRYQLWPEKIARSVGSAIADLPSLPQRAIQESENLRLTGDYNPAPIVEAAALASPVPAALRAGEKAIPGVAKNLAKRAPIPPTAEELASAGGRDISAAKASGLEIAPSAVADASRAMQQKLFDGGIHPVDAPNTYAKLKEIENAPAGSVFTAANLQSFRESLGHTAQNFNPNAAKDQLAASRAIKELDQLLPNVAEKDVLAGSPTTTQTLFERGRGNYAAGMRSNALTGELDRANTGILERAQNRAQATNSGRNLDNTIRQKIASVLEKPKEVSGYSDAELAALNDVIQGSWIRNKARSLGNMLGGGGGLGREITAGLGAGAGAALGGMAGQPVVGGMAGAIIPPSIGAGSKAIANALAKKSLNAADKLIRTRSPLYQEALRAAESYAPGVEKRAAIAKALLIGAITERR